MKRFLSIVALVLLSVKGSFAGHEALAVPSAEGDSIILETRAIGSRITDPKELEIYKECFKIALERTGERPHMWDIFTAANDTLLRFYRYGKSLLPGRAFKTIYLEIRYEDAHYCALMATTGNFRDEYRSMIVHEQLSGEEPYHRTTTTNGNRLRVTRATAGRRQRTDFLLIDENFVDLPRSTRTSELTSRSHSGPPNGHSSIDGRGQIKNGLKTGRWVDKGYSFRYGKVTVQDGTYVNGLRHGPWHFSPDGPVEMIKIYNMGRCTSVLYP